MTAKQREWERRTQIQPPPPNAFWQDRSRPESPGVFWITDDCAIVNLLPVCTFKLGKRKMRGDLFRDMKKYLDEIDSNPLP
jgi:hypothetical protein